MFDVQKLLHEVEQLNVANTEATKAQAEFESALDNAQNVAAIGQQEIDLAAEKANDNNAKASKEVNAAEVDRDVKVALRDAQLEYLTKLAESMIKGGEPGPDPTT